MIVNNWTEKTYVIYNNKTKKYRESDGWDMLFSLNYYDEEVVAIYDDISIDLSFQAR